MKVILNDVRLVMFQQSLWVASKHPDSPEDAPKKFGATFLFAPDSAAAKAVSAAVQAVATEKWKDKAAAILESVKGNSNKMCFLNGNSRPETEGFPGNLFLTAKNDARPQVIDRAKNPLVQMDGNPYSGCYVNGVVDIWAQDNKWGKGIRAKLLGVQFVRDGDAFVGGASLGEDDFSDLSDGEDAPDLGMSQAGGSLV